MKIRFICALLLGALIYSCDDSTTGIGNNLMPEGDRIPAYTDSYEFSTRSILSDSVYARTSTAYLGQYTDEQFGEFSADFIAQFTCPDDFQFHEDIISARSVKLYLFYSKFFGDSLSPMRVQVDSLDKVIRENDKNTYYTSVKPEDYYNNNAKPLAIKALSATGPSVESDITSDGVRSLTQVIKLPTQLGDYFLQKYKEDSTYYKDADAFINNVFKGVYIRCTHGDGTILYLDEIRLAFEYNAMLTSSSGKKDSLVVFSSRYFAATKEVIQANHFQNSDRLKEIVADGSGSYVKSPAGIYTEVTFPFADIALEHKNDTLNGVSVTFTRYNDKSDTNFKMEAPNNLLMVRKQDMYSFFEANKLYDEQTSFLSTLNGSTYTFSNISSLITHCINERDKGMANDPKWETKNPDWNKVVLIPVDCDYVTDSNGNTQITSIYNSLGMESAKLRGGEKDKLKMQIFYTQFSH